MGWLKKLIPREIRKPISKVTEKIEDTVRPVTDPIREVVDKIVPNEIKPYASTIATMLLPIPGGPLAGLLAGTAADAFFQKLLYDSDANKEVDWVKALSSGIGKGIQNIGAESLTQTVDAGAGSGVTNTGGTYTADASLSKTAADPNFYQRITGATTTSPYADATTLAADLNAGNVVASNAASGITAGEAVSNFGKNLASGAQDYMSFDLGSGSIKDVAGGVTKGLTAAQVINTPSQVKTAYDALKDAEEEYATYLNTLDEESRASFEADRTSRIAAYKRYMGFAGYSEDEIDAALVQGGYIEEGATAYAANGGRIGFADGSRDRDSLNMNAFYDEYPETQVGTYINENRYKSEKIEKLEIKLNELIDMRKRTADRSRNPENDGVSSLMEKLLQKEITNLYFEREKDNIRKSDMQKREEATAIMQQTMLEKEQQQKQAYFEMFGDGATEQRESYRVPFNLGGRALQKFDGYNNYSSKFDGRGRYNPATDGPPETKGEAEIYQSFLNNRKQNIMPPELRLDEIRDIPGYDFGQPTPPGNEFFQPLPPERMSIMEGFLANALTQRQQKFDGMGRYNPATDGPPETKGQAERYQAFINNMPLNNRMKFNEGTGPMGVMDQALDMSNLYNRYVQEVVAMGGDLSFEEWKQQNGYMANGGSMSMPDRPNFNYGSGRQTPNGDPIAPNVPPGMQMDLRPGGFIELGTEPRADDVPAMVGKDEFVLNDRAVAGIGKLMTGVPDARAGAKALYELQNQMEATV